MTTPLLAEYEARVATADDEETINALVDALRKDRRLTDVGRNKVYDLLVARLDAIQKTAKAAPSKAAAQLLEGRSTGAIVGPESREGSPPPPVAGGRPPQDTTPARATEISLGRPAEVRDLGLQGQLLVSPIATPAQARAAWDAYVAMAKALEDPADVVEIEGKAFRRKSFWRKIALAYGIDVVLREATQELKDDAEGAYWSAHVVVRASSRTGRHVDGVASCSNREPNKRAATAHVVYATAYTRAANRAIADLVAAGEVSAEEVE